MSSGLQRVDRDDHPMCGRAVAFVDDERGLEMPGIVESVYDVANGYGGVIDTRVVIRLAREDDTAGKGTLDTASDRVEVVV